MKTVAVAGGTGGLGKFIVEALVEHPSQFKVVLLTRDSTKPAPPNVTVRQVDYSSVDSIASALHHVDWFVSAVTTTATGQEQIIMADACKKANVHAFIPSEFGIDTSLKENQIDIVGGKRAVAEHCKKIGVNCVRVMSGCFIDTFFLPWFEVDLEKGTAKVVGDGNQSASFTHRRDVGRFVAQIIIEDLVQPVIRLSGQDLIINDALHQYEQIKGQKVNISYASIQDTMERIKKATDAWERGMSEIKLSIAKGYCLHKDAIKPNGFTPITCQDYFKTL